MNGKLLESMRKRNISLDKLRDNTRRKVSWFEKNFCGSGMDIKKRNIFSEVFKIVMFFSGREGAVKILNIARQNIDNEPFRIEKKTHAMKKDAIINELNKRILKLRNLVETVIESVNIIIKEY